MGTNRTDEYAFSIDVTDGKVYCDVRDDELKPAFESTGAKADVSPRYVTEAEFRVERPEEVPVELFKDKMWDEYTKRWNASDSPDRTDLTAGRKYRACRNHQS